MWIVRAILVKMELKGATDLTGLKVAVVAAKWNELVSKALLEGAVEALEGFGAEVVVAKVAGSWEVPVVARALVKSGEVAGVVAVGCILQGATPHAQQLAADVSGALMGLQMETGVPVAWGILTPETQEQALERAGMKLGNKGRDAAVALAETIGLLRATR